MNVEDQHQLSTTTKPEFSQRYTVRRIGHEAHDIHINPSTDCINTFIHNLLSLAEANHKESIATSILPGLFSIGMTPQPVGSEPTEPTIAAAADSAWLGGGRLVARWGGAAAAAAAAPGQRLHSGTGDIALGGLILSEVWMVVYPLDRLILVLLVGLG